jgi:hypothetical protein
MLRRRLLPIAILALLGARPAGADILLTTTPGVVPAGDVLILDPEEDWWAGQAVFGRFSRTSLGDARVGISGLPAFVSPVYGARPGVVAAANPNPDEGSPPWLDTTVELDGYGWKGFGATFQFAGRGTLLIDVCSAPFAVDPDECYEFDVEVGPGESYIGLEAAFGAYGTERFSFSLDGDDDFRLLGLYDIAFGGVEDDVVPEPGVAVLIGLGAIATLVRRRGRRP